MTEDGPPGTAHHTQGEDDLSTLLRRAADAHHEAFASTGGADPRWPEWYAGWLETRLGAFAPPPVVDATSVAWLSAEQMAEADRLATEEFGISLLQMMEHAGAALAVLVDLLLPEGAVTVLAGGGNNGAGGLCAARHLVDGGRDVQVVVASEDPGEAARRHLRTLSAMGIEPTPDPGGDVAVDALVGYGLEGALRGRAAELARWSSARPTVSLDFPSGHGHAGAVSPTATLTLALPKHGLRDADHPLYLADIGLPEALWERLGVASGRPFGRARIVRIEH